MVLGISGFETTGRPIPIAGVLVAMESGAAVADLDGKDIDWSCGPLLSKNRGLFATDPKKARKRAKALPVETGRSGRSPSKA